MWAYNGIEQDWILWLQFGNEKYNPVKTTPFTSVENPIFLYTVPNFSLHNPILFRWRATWIKSLQSGVFFQRWCVKSSWPGQIISRWLLYSRPGHTAELGFDCANSAEANPSDKFDFICYFGRNWSGSRGFTIRGVIEVSAMDPRSVLLAGASLTYPRHSLVLSGHVRFRLIHVGDIIEMEPSHPINEPRLSHAWPKDKKPLLLRAKGWKPIT